MILRLIRDLEVSLGPGLKFLFRICVIEVIDFGFL